MRGERCFLPAGVPPPPPSTRLRINLGPSYGGGKEEYFFACHNLAPHSSVSVEFIPFPLISMKKVSLLMGTLGGAMAGYLFSNKKLREELADAKNPESAAMILAKHVKDDGKKIGKEVWEFAKSDEVQKNFGKAKKYAESQFSEAKKKVEVFMKKEAKDMKKMAKKAKSK